MKYASRIFCLLLLLFFTFPLFADEGLIASVDRANISLNETLQLTLTYSGKVPPDTSIDFSKLQKDFEIIGIGQEREYSNINGQLSQFYHWTVTLAPRKSGIIMIPSFQVENFKSQPIQINVNDANIKSSSVSQNQHSPIFMQTLISETAPYIQSPVLYTVKIFYNVMITNPEFIPPSSSDLTIKPIGQDIVYETAINGKAYRVFERNYMVFANKPGHFTITPGQFMGQMIDVAPQPHINRFLNANFPQDFAINGKPLVIDVKPMPTHVTGWWLPAEQLILKDQWSIPPEKWQQGQPVTRTLSLQAKGARAEQLPPLEVKAEFGFNLYAGKVKSSTQLQGKKFVALRSQEFVYAANQSGQIHIPSVSISWWDINQHVLKTETLQGFTVYVPETKKASPISTTSARINSVNAASLNPQPQKNQINDISSLIQNPWFFVAAISIGVWILTFYWSWRKNRKQAVKNSLGSEKSREKSGFGLDRQYYSEAKQSKKVTEQLNEALTAVGQACHASDPVQTHQALLNWFKILYPEENNQHLNFCIQKCGSSLLAEELKKLERALYGQMHHPWDGLNFWAIFKSEVDKAFKKPKHDLQMSVLPELYPDSHLKKY